MIIEKFKIEKHQSVDIIFILQNEEDKLILKNILQDLFVVQFTLLNECSDIDNLKLLQKYNFKFNYQNNKNKQFVEISN